MSESDQNKTNILQLVSKLIPIALMFLMPVFFLPTTTEFFEFNKMMLLTTATLLIIALWAVKIVTKQKVEFVKSPMDLPLMALGLVFVLATVFSVHRYTSMFGAQGRWYPSLFGFLVMIAYFFFATPLLKDIKTIKAGLYALLVAGTVSSIVSLLSYFNIFLGSAEYFRIQNFTLTGSVTTSVLLAVIAFIIAAASLSYEKNQPLNIVMIATSIVNFMFIALTGTLFGWLALALGLITTLVIVEPSKIVANKLMYFVMAGALTAILLVTILPATRSVLVNKNYPQELNLPARESWIIATSTMQDYPLLATGPSTFGLNYTRYRPLISNAGDTWSLRYDKPFNEVFNTLASIGLIGMIVSLLVAVKVARIVSATKASKDESGSAKVAAILLVVVGASYLMTYATVLNSFLFFALLGMLIAAEAATNEQSKITETVSISSGSFSTVSSIGEMNVVKKEYFRYIIAVPVLLLLAYVGFLTYKNYMGEYYMRMSLSAARDNDAAKIYEYQRMAIMANPDRDSYQSAYARTNLILANALASKQDLTDTDKQTIQGLISQAIRSARVVTEVVSPLNVANWETRALVYSSITGVAQNAAEWAVGAYNTAIQLDPTNPRLRLDLGGVYFASGDYLTAANLFRQATSLKSDYANAHYNFAQALVKLNDVQGAVKELEVVKTLVPAGSEDYKRVDEEIATLNKQQPKVAGASDSAKPTVEELSGQNGQNPTQANPQEPLKNPGAQTLPTDKLNVQTLPQNTPTPTPANKQ